MHRSLLYLLKSCVFDSVGVVMIIDYLKVTNCLSWAWRCKMHFRLGLASSLCVNGEVGWSAHLNSYNTHICQYYYLFQSKQMDLNQIKMNKMVVLTFLTSENLTCFVESRALCPHLARIMGRIYFDFERTNGNFLTKKVIKIRRKL